MSAPFSVPEDAWHPLVRELFSHRGWNVQVSLGPQADVTLYVQCGGRHARTVVSDMEICALRGDERQVIALVVDRVEAAVRGMYAEHERRPFRIGRGPKRLLRRKEAA